MIEKISAKYAVNIHGLFTGQSHFEDVESRKGIALLTAEVFRYLDEKFDSMSMDEKTHIAVEFVGQSQSAVTVDLDNLFESIRIVTGDKYLTYEILDLSRFRAAPSARLGHFPFESDGAFPGLWQGSAQP
ncbi:MAG: hypothetical protein AAF231_05125 [Pseudomonadota bacterium]